MAKTFKNEFEEVYWWNNHPSWINAGLSIQAAVGYDSRPEAELRKGIDMHNSVVEYLVSHCNEPDFDEKYFYGPKQVKYYEVLDLAEREAA